MLTLKNEQIHITPHAQQITAFKPQVAAVACFLDLQGKLLLLHTDNPQKAQNKVWGVPGGKIEIGETPDVAVLREVREETGIVLNASDLQFVSKLYVRAGTVDFEFYVYKYTLNSSEEIKVVIDTNEHSQYIWATPQEALNMQLLLGEREIIEYMY